MTSPAEAAQAPDSGLWLRLDPRMLLVHPVREVGRFLPALVALVFVGGGMRGGGIPWEVLGVVVPVALGVLRYVTTRYRIHDGRVELRQGLLQRRSRTAQLDRVRTIDLSSSLVQRLLGLSTVRIGTGAAGGSEDIDLDGLPTERARELRTSLLAVAQEEHQHLPDTDPAQDPTQDHATETEQRPAPPPAPEEPPVLRLDVSWVRYAPLTSAGLAAAGAVFAVIAQGGQQLDLARRVDDLDAGVAGGPLAWVALAVVVALGVLAVSSVLAVLGYLVTNWGLELRRTTNPRGRAEWRLTRGLTTTRETSVDVERLAGMSVDRPLGLRLARAGRASAIVTGLDGGSEGSLTLGPPAPAAVVDDVAGRVLGSTEPFTAPLRPHGPAAVRRRWTRALLPALVLGAGLVLAVVVLDAPLWLLVPAMAAPLVAAPLAADRARTLGHALVDRHVVARSGSLLMRREALAAHHVIGWNLSDTWFQRRVGLTTLTATTAGGRQAVTVLDVPEEEAVVFADEAVPGLLSQFRA